MDKIIPEPNTGCWLWTAFCMDNGYGQFTFGGKHYLAHRASYTHFNGVIPEEKQIDHICKVRCCVNPDHLEAVTCRENLLRGETVTAHHATKNACDNGHPYTAENTRVWKGIRICRACHRQRARKVA